MHFVEGVSFFFAVDKQHVSRQRKKKMKYSRSWSTFHCALIPPAVVLVVPSADMTTSRPFSLPVAISVSLAAHLPPLPPASLSSTIVVILPAGLTPPVDGSP